MLKFEAVWESVKKTLTGGGGKVGFKGLLFCSPKSEKKRRIRFSFAKTIYFLKLKPIL